MDEYTVAVGDTVTISSGGRSRGSGVVKKIGPKLVHIDEGYKVVPYIRETQQRRDGYPGFFQTQEQSREAAVIQVAREALRGHGVEISTFRVLWTGSQLEALVQFVEDIHPRESDS